MKVIDPVCGLEVDTGKTDIKFNYRRVEYFFCSPSWLEAFKVSQGSFLGREKDKEKVFWEQKRFQM